MRGDIENYIRIVMINGVYSYKLHHDILRHCHIVDNKDLRYYRREIISGFARCLFVSEFAQWIEEDPDERQSLHPGSGGDYMDVAPETSKQSMGDARFSLKEIERINNIDIAIYFEAMRTKDPEMLICKTRSYLLNEEDSPTVT